MTDKESFESVEQWIKDTQEFGRENLILCLIGNKTDLVDQRKISQEEGKQLGSSIRS